MYRGIFFAKENANFGSSPTDSADSWSGVGDSPVVGVSPTTSLDAFSYTLGYYANDYTPIAGGGVAPDMNAPSSATDLFNGNISFMATDIQGLGLQGMAYGYDQLHRIKMAMHTCWEIMGNGLALAAGMAPPTAMTPTAISRSSPAITLGGCRPIT